MQNQKKQVVEIHDEEIKREHQRVALQKEKLRLRQKVNNLDDIPLDTEEPATYTEFKEEMERIHDATFDRKYLRKLHRGYLKKWKVARVDN